MSFKLLGTRTIEFDPRLNFAILLEVLPGLELMAGSVLESVKISSK